MLILKIRMYLHFAQAIQSRFVGTPTKVAVDLGNQN